MSTRQPEALRLAHTLSGGKLIDDSTEWADTLHAAAAELRHQHARIAELESKLSVIGAGGVSGPLIGQPQAMPDLSQLTERGAVAWAGVDAQGLRGEGFTAADMATAESRGFKDGVASLSANAGEPRNAIDRDALIDAIAQGLHGTWHCTRVWEAWHVGTMSQDDFEPVDESETPTEIADAVLALLSAPPTAQAEGWMDIETAPKDGTEILLHAPVVLPKPVGWLHRHPVECKNGEVWNYPIASGDEKDGWEEFPLYTEQQVRDLLAEVSAAAAQEGWCDGCNPDNCVGCGPAAPAKVQPEPSMGEQP